MGIFTVNYDETNIRVLYPPSGLNRALSSVFLAGPIQGAPEWQQYFIDKVKESYTDNTVIQILNPRRTEFNKEKFVYEQQVDWETNSLNSADIIVFWLCNEVEHIEGRDYAQTSRFEIGEWVAKICECGSPKKIIIGIEDGFKGDRYIKYRTSKFGIPIYNNLDDIINEVINSI